MYQHSYVACVREGTQNLPDIDAVAPFGPDDAVCLKEVNEVLRKHNATARFGVSLLHSHFPMAEDEILLEETDVLNRRQTISVIKMADAPTDVIYMDRRFDTAERPAKALYKQMRGYQNDLMINKLQSDMKLSPVNAADLFEDVKRFIALCATTPDPLGLSRKIDQAWHTFILLTKDYAKFCDKYCGRYIHHTPSDPFGVGKDYLAERRKTYDLAHAMFGPLSSNWNDSPAGCTHNCTNGD
jgi:hypothetical protein